MRARPALGILSAALALACALLVVVVLTREERPSGRSQRPRASGPEVRPATADIETPRPIDPELRKILDAIPGDPLLDLLPDEAYRRLVRMRDRGVGRGGSNVAAEARRLLERTRRHLERLHEDPVYRIHHQWRIAFRLHPAFPRYHHEAASRPPYLVFHVVKSRTDGAKERAARLAEILLRFHEEFHRLLGRALELPRIADRPEPDVLKVVVFASPELLREYQRSIGRLLSHGAMAYYSPGDQWVVLATGESPGAGETVAALDARRLVRVATYQLMHYYARVVLETKLGSEVDYEDPRVHSRRFWLQEGLPDLLAGGFGDGSAAYDLARPRRSLLELWRESSARGEPDWSLAELLVISGRDDLERECEAKARRQGDLGEAERHRALAFAQAWAFCHFLWNHASGRDRGKLVEALRGELTGHSNQGDWVRIWTGGKGEPDWSTLEAEWRAYVAGLPE
jgi:hypothetical protein